MDLGITTTDLPVDAIVGDRYRIVRKIGEGGMCVVYEAQHIKLQRAFALKALRPALKRNEEAVERFVREAELLGSLRHRNVVGISDWLTLPDGSPCMVLEFLHGASLQVRLLRAPLSWEAIARLADQTMSALSLSHRLGITHRDLKPENIYISIDDSGDEQAKLLDFGISKLRGVGRLSGAHKMLGTPSYMAPEQVSGNTDLVGPHTDVWAMGAILYEMATQQTAFMGQDLMQTLELIQSARPPAITNFRPDAPPEFIDLVDRAISHDSERRIQTIEVLRDLLRKALVRTEGLTTPRLTVRPGAPIRNPTPVPTPTETPPPPGLGQLSLPTKPTPAGTPPPPGLGQLSFPTKPPPPTATVLENKTGRTWLLVAIVALLVTAANVAIALFL